MKVNFSIKQKKKERKKGVTSQSRSTVSSETQSPIFSLWLLQSVASGHKVSSRSKMACGVPAITLMFQISTGETKEEKNFSLR